MLDITASLLLKYALCNCNFLNCSFRTGYIDPKQILSECFQGLQDVIIHRWTRLCVQSSMGNPGALAADDWIENIIHETAKKGIHEWYKTWQAVRGAIALKLGERFGEPSRWPFEGRWNYVCSRYRHHN